MGLPKVPYRGSERDAGRCSRVLRIHPPALPLAQQRLQQLEMRWPVCPERKGPRGTYPAVSRVVRVSGSPLVNQRVVRALFSLLYSEPMPLSRGTLVCQCVYVCFASM